MQPRQEASECPPYWFPANCPNTSTTKFLVHHAITIPVIITAVSRVHMTTQILAGHARHTNRRRKPDSNQRFAPTRQDLPGLREKWCERDSSNANQCTSDSTAGWVGRIVESSKVVAAFVRRSEQPACCVLRPLWSVCFCCSSFGALISLRTSCVISSRTLVLSHRPKSN